MLSLVCARWSNVFDVMTQAREEEEDAGAVSARQAGDMCVQCLSVRLCMRWRTCTARDLYYLHA